VAKHNRHRERERHNLERMRAERERLERERLERTRRLAIGGALLALAALIAAGALLGPDLPGPDASGVSLLAVLGIGLTAGGLSCLAVQGGLLTVAVTGPGARHDTPPASALAGNAHPILWFLGAKLAAYTALGAALGALGQLAQPSVTLRVVIQAATAVLMIATALHFLGVHPIFRYAIIQPPRFLTRRISATARGTSAFTPALLGAMTIFLPCGVTQAMQLVAINSGSPAIGGATLAVFVLGTSPLFFSLGYFATRLNDALHARFLKLAAVAILGVALFSLDGALRLGGSPVTFAAAKEALLSSPPPVVATAAADGVQEARILVSSGGYSPARVQISAGEPARVVFASDGAAGCALALVFEGQQMILPQTGETPIDLPPQQPGEIDYTCAMGMYGGRIEVV
jgi:sulfite exporter TauE/SafE